ncbi:MAG: YfiR family protein [Vicingaceae bacterium]
MVKRLFGLIMIGVLSIAAGSGNFDTNAKIKAIYIYNFTKYIEWPKDYRETNFVIGVLGDSPLFAELERMSASKQVFGQAIEVKKFLSASAVEKCHILYIPTGSSEPFSSVVSKIQSNSTLLVTDTPGMALKGSAINFVVQQNRQKFELNQNNAVKYNLKVSNSLEALAIIVN